jgi:hypothetical protein
MLAITATFFFTLYPFHATTVAQLPDDRYPFLLGGWGRDLSTSGIILNILLFVPYGFAIACKCQEKRNESLRAALIMSLVVGSLTAYAIEYLQLYFPPRDSGWADVVTNTIGSGIGAIVFVHFGPILLKVLSETEKKFEELLPWPRASSIAVLYFIIWLVLSIFLQERTRLKNWNANDFLAFGNDSSGAFSPGWKGELRRFELWNHSLPIEDPEKIPNSAYRSQLTGDYDFSAARPLKDQTNSLPDLSWNPKVSTSSPRTSFVLQGDSWLASSDSVSTFVQTVRTSNQFALRVFCEPSVITGIDAPIVSISARKMGLTDMGIEQIDSNLIVLLRNLASGNRYVLSWPIRNVVEANRSLDIVFSYDGSNGRLYVNGSPSGDFILGPGAVLYRYFEGPQISVAMDACNSIYYLPLFFPMGVLGGIASKSILRRAFAFELFYLGGTFLAAVFLEFVLVNIGGRPVSFKYVAVSIIVAIAGRFWIGCGRAASAGPEFTQIKSG